MCARSLRTGCDTKRVFHRKHRRYAVVVGKGARGGEGGGTTGPARGVQAHVAVGGLAAGRGKGLERGRSSTGPEWRLYL